LPSCVTTEEELWESPETDKNKKVTVVKIIETALSLAQGLNKKIPTQRYKTIKRG